MFLCFDYMYVDITFSGRDFAFEVCELINEFYWFDTLTGDGSFFN